jgi:hypothetical protein
MLALFETCNKDTDTNIFSYINVVKICPKLGTKNNLPSKTVAVHKYYPKLEMQNNPPNTTAVVHEVKRQEDMSGY